MKPDRTKKIRVFDLAEYLSLACGIKIEREDPKMLKLVNRAYKLCISGYGAQKAYNLPFTPHILFDFITFLISLSF
ncbi:hypothetical protein [Methanosarcina barkeri]|uniref:hypothetical protein n=1 Tax=Methanosarcina barkeri TaxID=2208 RepID=UPI000B030017|nr:hypothetical protein [Methanosarcina barkeri]